MLIVADENIPAAPEMFGGLGTVRQFSGRHLVADDLAGADVLLVRSVTKVNAELLANSAKAGIGRKSST